MTTEIFCFYLQNILIQTSQTGGQRYSDTSPFSIPCCSLLGLLVSYKENEVLWIRAQQCNMSDYQMRRWTLSSLVKGEEDFVIGLVWSRLRMDHFIANKLALTYSIRFLPNLFHTCPMMQFHLYLIKSCLSLPRVKTRCWPAEPLQGKFWRKWSVVNMGPAI